MVVLDNYPAVDLKNTKVPLSKVVDNFSRPIISRSAELFWPYLVSFERCFVKLTFDTWNLKKSRHTVSEFDLNDVKLFYPGNI